MIAERLKTYVNKLQVLQRKLRVAAKMDRRRKFGILYDKVYWTETLQEAWKRVRANRGAGGVDGETIELIEKQYGVSRFLKEIQTELSEKRYRPEKVKRVWIDKPGRNEKRPLGIPMAKAKCTLSQQPFGICKNYTPLSLFSGPELSDVKNEEYFWYKDYFVKASNKREFCCA